MPEQTLQASEQRSQSRSPDPHQSGLQEVLHSPHATARMKVWRALDTSYRPTHRRWASRMAGCGTAAAFFVDPDTGKVRPWISRCHHRLCPFCARARSAKVAAQIQNLLIGMAKPSHLVLTLKSSDEPLEVQLRRLGHSFGRLRRTKLWRSSVVGGVAVKEMTWNADTGQWHPHIHAVLDAKYMPQKVLRRLWHEITGDAEVVWISAVTDRPNVARELAKYIGKPQHLAALDANQIRSYATAIHLCRLVATFGNCYGRRVEDQDLKDHDAPSTYRVSLSGLVHDAKGGDVTSQRLALLISKRWPVFAPYILHTFPQLDPEESRAQRTAAMLRMLKVARPPPCRSSPIGEDQDKLDSEIFLQFCRLRHEQEELPRCPNT